MCSCLAFRIQRTSRCQEFTAVLSISYCFLIYPPPHPTPSPTKLKGVHWFHLVRLSVCGQNRVRCVSSTILATSISYLQILSTNFRMCVACWFLWQILKFEFLAFFFLISPFTLSCVHVMRMLIPLIRVFYCSNLKFPMLIPLGDLLNISSEFGPNYNSVFLAFFFQLYLYT